MQWLGSALRDQPRATLYPNMSGMAEKGNKQLTARAPVLKWGVLQERLHLHCHTDMLKSSVFY